VKIGGQADVEPYGHLSDKYQADDWFRRLIIVPRSATCSAASRLAQAVQGTPQRRHRAFTPDNVPVFDWAADNAWMIADSNHGFKMIAWANSPRAICSAARCRTS
jgi:hypothetical protein